MTISDDERLSFIKVLKIFTIFLSVILLIIILPERIQYWQANKKWSEEMKRNTEKYGDSIRVRSIDTLKKDTLNGNDN